MGLEKTPAVRSPSSSRATHSLDPVHELMNRSRSASGMVSARNDVVPVLPGRSRASSAMVVFALATAGTARPTGPP